MVMIDIIFIIVGCVMFIIGLILCINHTNSQMNEINHLNNRYNNNLNELHSLVIDSRNLINKYHGVGVHH